jgi:hypothetical protein
MWWQQNKGIIALLILVFPAGLYLMWKYAAWAKSVKITVSLMFATLIFAWLAGATDNALATVALIYGAIIAFLAVKNRGKVVVTASYNSQSDPQQAGASQLLPFKKHFIPSDVIRLLWFSDGPYRNYDPRSAEKYIETEYVTIAFHMNTDVEPSTISINDLVQKPNNSLFVQPMGYFPQYSSMTPEQRWIYLNWLCNVDEMVDIGYVFVFYYGLERHLFEGTADPAFDMILRLRKVHKNESFQHYSMSALLSAMLFHKKADMYEKFVKETEEIITISDLFLFVKYLLKMPIFPEELIACASQFNFTNKRYIRSDYELFLEIFTKNLKEIQGEGFVMWDGFELKNCQMTRAGTVANTSLSPREITIPNVLSNAQFFGFVPALFNKTHEEVKLELKHRRKMSGVEEKENE